MTRLARASLELSLLTLAQQHVERLDCLRPDIASDSEAVITSLCQFDFLAALIAIDDAGEPTGSAFYTSFARWYSSRTVPVVLQLLEDEEMRSIIFHGSNEQLPLALQVLNERASHEAFAFAGWMGYENDHIQEFINEYLPDDYFP